MRFAQQAYRCCLSHRWCAQNITQTQHVDTAAEEKVVSASVVRVCGPKCQVSFE